MLLLLRTRKRKRVKLQNQRCDLSSKKGGRNERGGTVLTSLPLPDQSPPTHPRCSQIPSSNFLLHRPLTDQALRLYFPYRPSASSIPPLPPLLPSPLAFLGLEPLPHLGPVAFSRLEQR
jgi:hypothetical protein